MLPVLRDDPINGGRYGTDLLGAQTGGNRGRVVHRPRGGAVGRVDYVNWLESLKNEAHGPSTVRQ